MSSDLTFVFNSFSVYAVIVLFIISSVNGHEEDPISKCLQGADYEELLEIVEEGLPPSKSPHHVAIVGGGIAGFTAAKFLEDAGHKVNVWSLLHNPQPCILLTQTNARLCTVD